MWRLFTGSHLSVIFPYRNRNTMILCNHLHILESSRAAALWYHTAGAENGFCFFPKATTELLTISLQNNQHFVGGSWYYFVIVLARKKHASFWGVCSTLRVKTKLNSFVAKCWCPQPGKTLMELEGLQSSLLSASSCKLKSGGLSATHLSTEQCRAVGKMQSLMQGWKGRYKGRSYIYPTVRMKTGIKMLYQKHSVHVGWGRLTGRQMGGAAEAPWEAPAHFKQRGSFIHSPGKPRGLRKPHLRPAQVTPAGVTAGDATARALQASVWGGPAGLCRHISIPALPAPSTHTEPGLPASELLHSDQKPSRGVPEVFPFWSGNWKAVVETQEPPFLTASFSYPTDWNSPPLKPTFIC